MAKKDKRSDRIGFQFEEGAGSEQEIFDLFADDYAPKTADEPSPDGLDEPGEEAEDASQEAMPLSTDKPMDDGGEIPHSVSSSFRFDRYGRRIGKKGERYGKRKNAPKATTTVVEHDTEAKREYDEARARAEQRAKVREKEAAMKAAVKRAEKAKLRKRSLSTALLGIAALIALAALTWFVTRITTIRVADVPAGYTEADIIALSRLQRGKSILFQSTKSAEAAIETDPYLEATVQYAFPSTVRIAVTKRTEAACVRWGPQNEYLAIIDAQGMVLNAASESANGLLIAEGLNISNAVGGTRLGDATDSQAATLIRLLTQLKELGLLSRTPKISRIDLTELMQIRFYLEGYPYTIEVGAETNLDTKLMLLQKHWDEILLKAADYIKKGSTTATIYLYSKGGVSVSPYEPGYAIAEPVYTFSPDAPASSAPATPDPNATEEPTVPSVTPMPHQDLPFTG